MNQFESFETPKGEVVVVNKATITFIKEENGNCRIFFNSLSVNNTVQSVLINCSIGEVERILNGE